MDDRWSQVLLVYPHKMYTKMPSPFLSQSNPKCDCKTSIKHTLLLCLDNVYIGKKYIKKEDCYSTIPNNPIGDIWDTYSGKEKKTITLFIACCHCKESQTYLFLVFCHCKPKPSLPNRSKFQTHTRYIVLKDFITDHMQCKCHYTANEILIL